MLPRAASEFYATQQRVSHTTSNEVLRLWRRMGDDFDASWRRIGPSILTVLVEGQQQVAEKAAAYVPAVLDETDLPDLPEGVFVPDSLAGMASDGRPLDTLAYGAVTQAKTAIGDGATTSQGLDRGGDWLDLMAKLQVADAARQAVSVQTAMRPTMSNYVRVLNPPSCQRCAVLAGRVYKWSTGFQRHPRCDCTMMPAQNTEWAKSEGFITDPMDAFKQGHIRDLTQAQVDAINEGADIGQVVNAYRGTSTTATQTRLRAAPPKPASVVAPGMSDLLAGIRPQTAVTERARVLTPEGIYQTAKTRSEAIGLLRQYGYITT